MDADLTILPIKDDPTKHKLKYPIHPNLPDISTGQLGLLVGKVKSGKGVLISNLLMNKNFYKDQFDLVYVISPTIYSDKTSRFLREQFPNTIFDKYSDKIIEDIIKYQESFPKEERPFIAVIADDIVGSLSNSISNKPYSLYSLLARYRHYNIGLMLIATQNLRSVPAIARANASFVMLSRTSNQKELEKITEEFGDSFGSQKNFLKLYNEATREPYSWAYLNFNENPPLFYKNFTTLLFPPTKQNKPIKFLTEDRSDEELSSDENSDLE